MVLLKLYWAWLYPGNCLPVTAVIGDGLPKLSIAGIHPTAPFYHSSEQGLLMSDNTEALRRMARAVEEVLDGPREHAEVFYRTRADEIGGLLDAARDRLPRGDAPLEPAQRTEHDAAEYLGQLYAALASWVLTGEPPQIAGRYR